ncbi:MAG: OPT/YSL family transporter, partial [Muribaculaceae bacterium]|nr:OPT/YSL family transporter [Muribaculaceae bacterium]
MKQEENAVETAMNELPENAFRELKEGEKYRPVLSPDRAHPEVTPYSVTMGLFLAVIFSAAAAYLGLKVGQVFEAAIPIAIIAVGCSSLSKRKNALGENVIIQSIGACSGVIVAGAIFTLPALYILQAKYPDLTVNFLQIFMSSLLGGILGILFFIPFRKYFVSDMHGKYPFPEATATTQVLISGEKAGSQALPLVVAGAIGGIYDFIVATFGWWSETISTTVTSWGQTAAEKVKMMFQVNTGAAVLGLGYIIGLKYALIIFAGSAFIWFVIIPLLGMSMTEIPPETIFKDFARPIGIGGIAMAGVIGIIKSWPIIRGAVGLAKNEMKGKGDVKAVKKMRWETDITMKTLLFAIIAALVVTFLFIWLGVVGSLLQAIVAFIVVVVIAFLFTTVAANAIAIVGSNPV